MEFRQLAARRRMTRTFAETAVLRQTLEAVVSCIRHAPSGAYAQGQRVVVVCDAARRAQIVQLAGDYGAWARSAPAIAVVLGSEASYRDRFRYADDREGPWPVPYWYVDAGAALMLILLAADDHGLGAGVFGLPLGRWEELADLIGVPPEVHVVALVALGYPAEDPTEAVTTSQLTAGRVPVRDRIHWDCWNDSARDRTVAMPFRR